MNTKRLIYATLAIFVFALLWNGVVHLVVLREANMALEGLVRPEADRCLLLSLLLVAGIDFLFVYSYALSARVGGIKRGLAHGLFFGFAAGLLVDFNQYLLYPIPGSLAVTWFIFGLVEFSLYGILVAWIYPVGIQPSKLVERSQPFEREDRSSDISK